jgi:hypothetical protein
MGSTGAKKGNLDQFNMCLEDFSRGSEEVAELHLQTTMPCQALNLLAWNKHGLPAKKMFRPENELAELGVFSHKAVHLLS